MATTTYLQLVNNAIKESGADLATFPTDFTSFGSSLADKFVTWTSRAWKSIQLQCYDWEFMEETAVVNIDPGILFYTDGATVSTISTVLTNTTQNMLDQDGSVSISNLNIGTFFDLTGKYTGVTQTTGTPFGYLDIANVSSDAPLQFALKPAAEHMLVQSSLTFTTHNVQPYGGFTGVIDNTSKYANTAYAAGNAYIRATITISGTTYTVAIRAFSSSPASINIFYSNAAVGTAIAAHGAITFLDPTDGKVLIHWDDYTSLSASTISSGSFPVTLVNGGALFVHGWKSYNFDEEIQAGDFAGEYIQEIDPMSFRIVDYYAAAPAQELPLPFMPWESFRGAYSQPAALPGQPRLITEDNAGRWQLYPALQQRYTLKFDYIRQPQILSVYTDIPKGVNDDFMDLIMWRTLMFYGEFDEQPSVLLRATKNYKDLLSRLEQKNREKFHFKPKRLW